ncbi:TPA: hypothetical protein DCL30_04380 [Candidatus Peribacteria bacterium]|nr:hypothetical protein [Candidatus Peribacteria bacterium]HAS34137.1 hypothetical protein [Candidatus Peribacteria bacterium]
MNSGLLFASRIATFFVTEKGGAKKVSALMLAACTTSARLASRRKLLARPVLRDSLVGHAALPAGARLAQVVRRRLAGRRWISEYNPESPDCATLSSMRIVSLPVALVGIFLIPALAFAAFPDVPQDHPNADAVAYVQSEGIVKGYADGTFKPEQVINRAELTKIIVGAALESDQAAVENCLKGIAAESWFTDVDTKAWFAGPLCIARTHGIIGGYADGSFKPEQPINFVEASKIIGNAFGITALVTPVAGDPWYGVFVKTLEQRAAVPQSIQRFEQPLTRGEMAEIIYRLAAGVSNKPTQTYVQMTHITNELPALFPLTFRNFVVLLSLTKDRAEAVRQSRNLEAWVLPTDLTANLKRGYFAVVYGPYQTSRLATDKYDSLSSYVLKMAPEATVVDTGVLRKISSSVRDSFASLPRQLQAAFAGSVHPGVLAESDVRIFWSEEGGTLCQPIGPSYYFQLVRKFANVEEPITDQEEQAIRLKMGVLGTQNQTDPLHFRMRAGSDEVLRLGICLN